MFLQRAPSAPLRPFIARPLHFVDPQSAQRVNAAAAPAIAASSPASGTQLV
jgi:hypothetical protein